MMDKRIKMERLTYPYIRKNFNITKECIVIEDRRKLGEISTDFNDNLKVLELGKIFEDRLKEYPSDAFIRSFPYGYDCAETIEVFQYFNRNETESETIKRLIKMVKEQRAKQNVYEKALQTVGNGIS